MTTVATDAVMDFDEALAKFDPVLGLEVHVELHTATKMFCGCPTEFGAEPNTQVCPVCLGLPGALPVVNEKAVESAIRIGLALSCEIAEWCRFARKNYFYPDLPKNFQTSQYDEPIAFEGYLDVELEDGTRLPRRDRARAHGGGHRQVAARRRRDRPHPRRRPLARRLQPRRHPAHRDRHQADVRARGSARRRSPRPTSRRCATCCAALDVSDVRMEQGSMRCDANVSLRPRVGDPLTRSSSPCRSAPAPRPRTSTRCARSSGRCATRSRARPRSSTRGGTIMQETRHWHEDTGITTSGRVKSDADDYRYFPEPDLVPVAPSRETVEALRGTLPEPPGRASQAAPGRLGLQPISRCATSSTPGASSSSRRRSPPAPRRRPRASGGSGELARRANAEGQDVVDVRRRAGRRRRRTSPSSTGSSTSGRLNDSMARQVLEGVLAGEGTPTAVADARGLALVSGRRRPRGGRRRGHRGQPRRRGQDPRRQGAGRRRAHRPGHEGDEGPGRRRQGPRAHPRQAPVTPAAVNRRKATFGRFAHVERPRSPSYVEALGHGSGLSTVRRAAHRGPSTVERRRLVASRRGTGRGQRLPPPRRPPSRPPRMSPAPAAAARTSRAAARRAPGRGCPAAGSSRPAAAPVEVALPGACTGPLPAPAPPGKSGPRIGRARAGDRPSGRARAAAEHAAQAALAHLVREPGHDDRREDRQQLLHEARPGRRRPGRRAGCHDLVGVAAEDVADDRLAVLLVDVVQAADRRPGGRDSAASSESAPPGPRRWPASRRAAPAAPCVRRLRTSLCVDPELARQLVHRHLARGSRRTTHLCPSCRRRRRRRPRRQASQVGAPQPVQVRLRVSRPPDGGQGQRDQPVGAVVVARRDPDAGRRRSGCRACGRRCPAGAGSACRPCRRR